MNQADESISSQFISEKGEKVTLDYSLVNSISQGEDLGKTEVFGIRVKKISQGSESETATISDITSSRKKALGIMKLISQNLVTPISLKDVVEDLVAE